MNISSPNTKKRIPYTSNLSRGKTFTVRTKDEHQWENFAVAASFNNEMSNLVNDSTKTFVVE